MYGEGLAWSSDGSAVIVNREQGATEGGDGRGGTQNWEIWRFRPDFSGPTRLTVSSGDRYLGGWSPDGSRIAFTTKRDDAGDVWVMAPDGTAARPVVQWPGSQSAAGFLADGRLLFADDNQSRLRWYCSRPIAVRSSGSTRSTTWRGLSPGSLDDSQPLAD